MENRSSRRVSVVIATKNSERTLGSCLESLSNQSYPPLEIIVVDNFSTDQTVAIAERYEAKVYRCGFERSEQRNYGIRLAQGDCVLLIDSDMRLSPEGVAESSQALEKNDAVILGEESFGEGFCARCKWLERHCYEGEVDIEAARGIRREVLLELGGYDEALFAFEDWDLHNRCLAAGYTIGRAGPGKPLLGHDEGRLSLWQTASKKRYYGRALKRYADKHPHVAKRQVEVLPRLRLFLRHWPLLARYPLLAGGVIVMKAVEGLFGFIGSSRSSARAPQKVWNRRMTDG